jgi:hypothetical protein
MKKLITALAGTGLLTMSLAIVGCGEKSEVKTEDKISTPGGTTQVTKSEKIKQTGDNPPSPGTATPTPPKTP